MFRTAPLTQHIDVSGHQFAGVSKHLALETINALVSYTYKFYEVAIVQAGCVVALSILKAEELSISLVGIEVGLGMEIGVGRVGSLLCRHVMVRAEQGAGNAVYARLDIKVSLVINLSRSHVFLTQGTLSVVHQLHHSSVVCTTAVGVVNLDGGDVRELTTFLHLQFVLLGHTGSKVVLCKNFWVAAEHFADFFSRIHQSHASALAVLGLLVLNLTPRGGSSLVACGVCCDDAVLPRTVWEIHIPVQRYRGLLVSVKPFKIVGIVLFYVIARGSLRQHDNTQAGIQAFLHARAVFGRSLSGLACKYVVLLVLLYHRIRVSNADKVVVKRLIVVVVGVPHLHAVQVDVGIHAVPLNGGFRCRKRSCCIANGSCFVTVLEHLDTSYTSVGGDSIRLYHNVKPVYHIHGIGYRTARSGILGVAVGIDYKLLTGQYEAHLLATALHQNGIPVGNVLNHGRKAQCTAVRLYRAVCVWLDIARCSHILSNA